MHGIKLQLKTFYYDKSLKIYNDEVALTENKRRKKPYIPVNIEGQRMYLLLLHGQYYVSL